MVIGSPLTVGAVEVSRQMQSAWTTFARDGEPGWAPYDEQRQLTRVFDIGDRGGVRVYPEAASHRLWADTPVAVLDLHV
jgi:para-nitrobenzyl esterase